MHVVLMPRRELLYSIVAPSIGGPSTILVLELSIPCVVHDSIRSCWIIVIHIAISPGAKEVPKAQTVAHLMGKYERSGTSETVHAYIFILVVGSVDAVGVG
jgi:hypothetical protein